jgi:hypothetical protein
MQVTYNAHSTLDGHVVWEPRYNWGRDYCNLDDAIRQGCIVLTEKQQKIAAVHFLQTKKLTAEDIDRITRV